MENILPYTYAGTNKSRKLKVFMSRKEKKMLNYKFYHLPLCTRKTLLGSAQWYIFIRIRRVLQANYFQKHHFTADIPFFGRSDLKTGALWGSFLTSTGSALILRSELQALGLGGITKVSLTSTYFRHHAEACTYSKNL